MDAFLVKNILPKLVLCLQEFTINPSQQQLGKHWWCCYDLTFENTLFIFCCKLKAREYNDLQKYALEQLKTTTENISIQD